MSGPWLPSVLSGIFGVGGVLLGIWLTQWTESKQWRKDVALKRAIAWAELQQKTAVDAQSAARQHWQAVVTIYRIRKRGEDASAEWARCSDAGSQVTTFAWLLDNADLRTDLSAWSRKVQTHAESAMEDGAEPITHEWMRARVKELTKLNERLGGEVRRIHEESSGSTGPGAGR